MGVRRLELRKARPEWFERKAVSARIDFTDGTLLFRGSRILDDRGDAAVVVAHNAPIARGIRKLSGKNRRRGARLLVRAHQRRKRLSAQQRRIPRHNQNIARATDRFARDEQRVPGAALRLLQNRARAERFHRRAHFSGLVSHDRHDLARPQRRTRAHHVIHQRPAADFVQNFCARRFQSRAFPRGQHHDHDIRSRHGTRFSDVTARLTIWFDNTKKRRAN